MSAHPCHLRAPVVAGLRQLFGFDAYTAGQGSSCQTISLDQGERRPPARPLLFSRFPTDKGMADGLQDVFKMNTEAGAMGPALWGLSGRKNAGGTR